MNINQIKEKLSQEFECIAFTDLAQITEQHQSAFLFLQSVYKECFKNNQRIVFYTAHNPDQLILDHLQRAVSKIDISNYFVLICSPYNINEKLSIANSKYGYDDTSISWYQIDINFSDPLVYDKIYPYETLCFAPFYSVDVDNKGRVRPCYMYDGSLGNVKEQSLPDIFNGDKVIKLRKQFRQGIKPTECHNCWSIEEFGGTSLRKNYLNKFGTAGDFDYIDNPKVKSLDIYPSRTCNFKCRICSPHASSSIAAEEIKFSYDAEKQKELLIKIQNTSLIDLDYYCQMIKPILPGLKDFHITGGEPTLVKNLPDFLEYVISSGHHTHIDIVINTNTSTWSDRLTNCLGRFRQAEILLSIDDIGKRFEVQRSGVWEEVSNNIIRWRDLDKSKFIVKLAPTVNIQNVFYLDQLVEYSQQLGIEIVWNYLTDPKVLCIDNMTKQAKNLVYQKYINHQNLELRHIAEHININTYTDGQEFIKLMTKYDQRRDCNFAQTHPEIFQAMSNR